MQKPWYKLWHQKKTLNILTCVALDFSLEQATRQISQKVGYFQLSWIPSNCSVVLPPPSQIRQFPSCCHVSLTSKSRIRLATASGQRHWVFHQQRLRRAFNCLLLSTLQALSFLRAHCQDCYTIQPQTQTHLSLLFLLPPLIHSSVYLPAWLLTNDHLRDSFSVGARHAC